MIISMDTLNPKEDSAIILWAQQFPDLVLRDFSQIVKLGASDKEDGSDKVPHFPPNAEDLCTICYTSGTTGNPKGAMLPQRCFLSPGIAVKYCGLDLGSTDTLMSYLPLAHCMERVFETALLASTENPKDRLSPIVLLCAQNCFFIARL